MDDGESERCAGGKGGKNEGKGENAGVVEEAKES